MNWKVESVLVITVAKKASSVYHGSAWVVFLMPRTISNKSCSHQRVDKESPIEMETCIGCQDMVDGILKI